MNFVKRRGFMKRMALVVGMVVLVFAVSLWAQTTAPQPDPELKKFDVFLGHWTYVGEYKAGLLGPASKVTGDWSGNQILGGFFFQDQFTEKGVAGETRGFEIIGYDPANKTFFSNEYHNDGNMLSGAYAFSGSTLTYTGKFTVGGKPYMIKATGILAADSMSFTIKAEISPDGTTWTPFFENTYTKTTPTPK
jgi:hypothetical protein